MENILSGKKILLGVTGSIAAYKSPLLLRQLVVAGAEVSVVMTPSAMQFVTPVTMSNLSRNPVVIEMFDPSQQSSGAWHIGLAHRCDLMIIAPCSAATIARLAGGLCDTALVAVAMALPRDVPFVIAPAMDTEMWLHPATQRNVELLRKDGTVIIPPAEGELASGLSGPGRLPEIESIIDVIEDCLRRSTRIGIENRSTEARQASKTSNVKAGSEYLESLQAALSKPMESLDESIEKDKWTAELELSLLKNIGSQPSHGLTSLKGKKVLITAGPTQEKIDDVRFISNYSSGKMGFALARSAREAGSDVMLIAGPVELDTPEGVHRIDVVTARQMYDAATKEFPVIDVAIMAAAVADFTPLSPASGKIKKQEVEGSLVVELSPTEDILATLGKQKKPGQVLVGFALEAGDEIENGFRKLKAKNCDMIVVNSTGKPLSGFGGDYNTITVLSTTGMQKSYEPMTKDECSKVILRHIADLLISKKSTGD